MNYEKSYLELCKKILDEGDYVEDRTGTGVYSIFGASIKHDLSTGFPILTTKKVNPTLPIGEMLWMLSGNTDLKSLREYQNKPEGSHTIWSDDFNKYVEALIKADPARYSEGNKPDNYYTEELGAIYGKQLRKFSLGYDYDDVEATHDQLTTLIENIKAVKDDPNHPMARRLRCVFWNPYDHILGDKITCALPACHTDFQCLVRGGKLHLSYKMRSNDWFLGQNFNELFYSTLCHCLAQITGLEAGELLYFGTDVHIYSTHLEQVKEQLSRTPRKMPKLILPEFETLEELLQLTGDDFKLEGYDPHPFIKAPQAS